MKKLKQRMSQCAADYLSTLDALPAHLKRDSNVPKLLNLVVKGGGAQGLDRTLGNLLRVIPKAQTCDFQAFLNMDGLGILASHVISKGMDDANNTEISKKSVILAVQLYRNACSVCPQIARHALLGNSIATMFDAIVKSFQVSHQPLAIGLVVRQVPHNKSVANLSPFGVASKTLFPADHRQMLSNWPALAFRSKIGNSSFYVCCPFTTVGLIPCLLPLALPL
ncbi:GH23261 [Drosophila grimshawi]|uniref:GH23261 n=1 Tax=Drosophila grimshawi TaxID=7222 RepID=B4K3W5_DROGR|nr:GH23261 [Drosophila grimshawi]